MNELYLTEGDKRLLSDTGGTSTLVTYCLNFIAWQLYAQTFLKCLKTQYWLTGESCDVAARWCLTRACAVEPLRHCKRTLTGTFCVGTEVSVVSTGGASVRW